jgi:hypothetical protein
VNRDPLLSRRLVAMGANSEVSLPDATETGTDPEMEGSSEAMPRSCAGK